ncbi:MAG TPA: purine nucleoside permease [Polyangiaceae bacterium]|jgi:purine nucleoside permease|nr:purine nucleoside permease [Polyangiaceae bacterium]
MLRTKRLYGLAGLLSCLVFAAGSERAARAADGGAAKIAVKVLVINMFSGEAQPFIDNLKLTTDVAVPGLSADYPKVHCNADDVCELTTGEGHTNVAASVSALEYSGLFDLTATYFMIAGISGIDPTQGTLGSAAWAHYLIDFGIQWEIDARTLPTGWTGGYLGINTMSPTEKPMLDYRTEVFELDPTLQAKAYALSKGAKLTDSDTAVAYRAHWDISPAKDPPGVVECDTAAGDTWWHGALLEKRAQDWTKLLTDGKGTYCTTQQEDNATYEALKRGASTGLLDVKRVLVLRTASNFDRPYPGQKPYDSLVTATSGGFVPSTANLYNVGGLVIADIVKNWTAWKVAVPK